MRIVCKNVNLAYTVATYTTETYGNSDISHVQWSNNGSTSSTNIKQSYIYIPIEGFSQYKIKKIDATYNPSASETSAEDFPKVVQRSGSPTGESCPMVREDKASLVVGSWQTPQSATTYLAIQWRDNGASDGSYLSVTEVEILLK